MADLDPIPTSEITPQSVYFNRRNLVRGALAAASAATTGLLYRRLNGRSTATVETPRLAGLTAAPASADAASAGFRVDEPMTPLASVTHYNNFYEFSTDKDGVADSAARFNTKGWRVSVEGLVGKPKVFDLDDLLKISPPEERVYRMRCVEAWSMVIPWVGFPLASLIKDAQPNANAKYVAFQTLFDPAQMPGQKDHILEWPYREGLRMDEAMHPLTLLAVGLYGQTLPNQDGAPIRLVVPWKYGFKGVKSIVRISFVRTQPKTTWSTMAPDEYGFYANVNPEVDHPRWSQATERRIGEFFRRKTLPFNGYGDQVASLYRGLDPRKLY